MNGPTRSGNGWRMTLPETGDPLVSIWSATPDDAETKAHKENMVSMRALEDERWRLEQEFHVQQWREYERIRARA